jgi:hypothetical protein
MFLMENGLSGRTRVHYRNPGYRNNHYDSSELFSTETHPVLVEDAGFPQVR